MTQSERIEPGGARRALQPALLIAGTVLSAMATTGFGLAGGPAAAPWASAAMGALLALVAATSASLSGRRAAARGPVAVWGASVRGMLGRMIFIGAGVVAASRFAWFRPVPFVATLGLFWFACMMWVAVSQNRALQAGAAGEAGTRTAGGS